MDIRFDSFIDSPPFKFLVGPEKKAYYIHTKLIAQLSDTLAKLVSGSMLEALEGVAVLDDIEDDTFLKAMEYAYTKDYSTTPEKVQDASTKTTVSTAGSHLPEPPPPEPPVIDDGWGDWGFSSSKKKKKGRATVDKGPTMWETFQAKATTESPSLWDVVRSNVYIYAPALLSHARLYVFADRYNVRGLQTLSLQKLRRELCALDLSPACKDDIRELVAYTYANTIDSHDQMDSLRALVTDYVACRLEDLSGSEEFVQLLRDTDDFLPDILSKINQRLD